MGNPFQLPNITVKAHQCKCAECFAIFRDGQGVVKTIGPGKLRCALDYHVIKDPWKESCPKGKPPL